MSTQDTSTLATGPPRGRPTAARRQAIGDRRERILAAATRLFADQGFQATTVRQVADAVDVLSGSLYHHFATKEDILAAIVRETVERTRDTARAIAEIPESADLRLARLVRASLSELESNGAVHAILYNERKFFRASPDFAFVVQAKKDAYAAWERIIADGVAQGCFVAGLDRFLTITAIVRMITSAADWFRGDDASMVDAAHTYDAEGIADFYCSFILGSLRRA